MSLQQNIRSWFTRQLLDLDLIQAKVSEKPARRPGGESLTNSIVPWYTSQKRVSIEEWQQAIDMARSPHIQERDPLYQVYENVMMDLHLLAVIGKRIMKVQGADWKLIDPDGEEDQGATELIEGIWFRDLIKFVLQSHFWGHSLIELWDLRDPAPVETNTGTHTLQQLKRVKLVERSHVKPDKGIVVRELHDTEGWEYRERPFDTFYIEIGDEKDLGLLMSITPIALYKRWALGHWSDYDEKMGIPFRWVTMKGSNRKREQKLAQIMEKMGAAGWAIVHENEKIELLKDHTSNPHETFLSLLKFCNQEMSKVIVGQTLTTETGTSGTRAQGEVHAEEADLIYQADLQFVLSILKTEVLPRLCKLGYPLDGYKIVLDDKQELNILDQIKVDALLLMHYKISPEYIAERYNIPLDMIEGKDVQEIEKVLEDASKKKEPEEVANHHHTCKHHRDIHSDLPHIEMKINKRDETYLREVWEAAGSAGWSWEYFRDNHLSQLKAIEEGWPVDELSFDYHSPDHLTRALFEADIHRFGFDKSAYQVLELNRLIKKHDTFEAFRDEAGKLMTLLNEQYLRTEFNTAHAASQNTARLLEHYDSKDTFPFLEYRTVEDERVRAEHAALNGKVFQISDPAVDGFLQIMPPLGHNCRCFTRPLRDYDGEIASLEGVRTALGGEWDRLKRSGFLINRLDQKRLWTDAQSYLLDLPEGERGIFSLDSIGFTEAGLQSWSEMSKDGFKPMQRINEAEARDLFRKMSDEENRAIFFDHRMVPIWMGQAAFNPSIYKEVFDEIHQVLNSADEIYFLGDTDDPLWTFIKYYEDGAIEVLVTADRSNPQRIVTWSVLSQDEIDDSRKGILIRY